MPSTSAARRASRASSSVQQPRAPCAGRPGICGQREVHPDDVVPGGDGPSGGHRRVDAAAHRGQHSHGQPSAAPSPVTTCGRPRSPGPLDDRRPITASSGVDVGRGARCGPARSAANRGRASVVGPHREQHVDGLGHPGRAGRAGGALDALARPAASAGSRPRSRGTTGARCPAAATAAVDRPVPGSPFSRASGTAASTLPTRSSRRPPSIAGRASARRRRRSRRRWRARRSPAMSSVPERTSRSCPPPCSSGVQRGLAAQQQRACAVRAAELVAGDGERVRAAGGEVDRQDPDGLHGVGVQRHPVLVGDLGELATGLTVPTSLLAHITDDHRRTLRVVRASAARRAAGCTRPVPVDGQRDDSRALVLGEPLGRLQHGVVLDLGDQHAACGAGRPRAGPSTGP